MMMMMTKVTKPRPSTNITAVYRVAQKVSHYQMIKKLLLSHIKTCK